MSHYDYDQTERKKTSALEGFLNDRSSSFGTVYKNKNRLMIIDTITVEYNEIRCTSFGY